MSDSNAIPIEAWNSVLFDKFCRFRYALTHGLSAHSDEVLRRRPYASGGRILDIGCGFGDTTRLIAHQVASNGSSAGVDCAPRFIELSNLELQESPISNIEFFVADVECDELNGPYDHAFSRFGTMFFNRPGAALRNIHSALSPGGTLNMVVWRRREDNPWVHDAEVLVRQMVPVVSHQETDQVHCGPGPFSMASADMVSELLGYAGFERISFERFDTEICIGKTLEEAVEFAMSLGPAGEIIRLAGKEGERKKDGVIDALRQLMALRLRPDGGVWMGSSSWLVSAWKNEHPTASARA
jgi:ubiquinone/menaquinone biosynthesis C-methylase UbiE